MVLLNHSSARDLAGWNSRGGHRLQSHKVALSVGRGASTIQRAVEALTDKEILREEEHEGGVRMRFEDPFFAQWIRAFPANLTGLTSLVPSSCEFASSHPWTLAWVDKREHHHEDATTMMNTLDIYRIVHKLSA
jgi:hypothetical protein